MRRVQDDRCHMTAMNGSCMTEHEDKRTGEGVLSEWE